MRQEFSLRICLNILNKFWNFLKRLYIFPKFCRICLKRYYFLWHLKTRQKWPYHFYSLENSFKKAKWQPWLGQSYLSYVASSRKNIFFSFKTNLNLHHISYRFSLNNNDESYSLTSQGCLPQQLSTRTIIENFERSWLPLTVGCYFKVAVVDVAKTIDHGRSDWLGSWAEFVQIACFRLLFCLYLTFQNNLT